MAAAKSSLATYACDQCEKRYTRPDYLARHVLNHGRPASICPLCSRTFKRPDVLRKHLEDSCKAASIVLQGVTDEEEVQAKIDEIIPRKRRRKRKDTSGETTVSLQSGPATRQDTDLDSASGTLMPGDDQDDFEEAAAEAAGTASMFQGREDHSIALRPNHGVATTVTMPTNINHNAGAAASGLATMSGSLLDTLSGPFVSDSPMNLFGEMETAPGNVQQGMTPATYAGVNGAVGANRDNMTGMDGLNMGWNTANQPDNMDVLFQWLFQPPADDWISGMPASDGRSQPTGQAQQFGPHPEGASVPVVAQPTGVSLPAITADPTPQPSGFRIGQSDQEPQSSQQAYSTTHVPPRITAPYHHRTYFSPTSGSRRPIAFHPFAVPNQPLDMPRPTFSRNWYDTGWRMPPPAPIIDDETRKRMLLAIEADEPDASRVLTVERMLLYLELYFIHFAPLYPLIHRASLGYRTLAPDLLLSMVCVGTAYASDKEAFHVATRIHKRIRNRVFERVEEEPRVDVASLQTLLLINHFSRSYCSLKQHDVSQIFHSPSIMMARLAGVFLPHYSANPSADRDPLQCWLAWVVEEERTRLGWFTFEMDTQNAACFRHSLLTHCFSIEIAFPSSSASFAAPDPLSWQSALSSSPNLPSFRNALRDLTSRGQIAAELDYQCLWILLHGLISVSWTLLWRDLGDLSMVHESKITSWKESLRQGFGVWESHTEALRLRRHTQDCQAGSNKDEDDQLYWAGRPFSRLGCVLLLTDTEQIRIFAGASNVTGRPISPGEWTAANTYVTNWARSQDSAYACQASMQLLSHVYKYSDESRFLIAPTVVVWGVYIAALVVWAHAAVTEGQAPLTASYIITSPSLGPPSSGLRTPEVEIEPSLARRDALRYLDQYLGSDDQAIHPFDIPDIPGRNACVGVIAYTAYLVGRLRRGVMDESGKVLVGLLTEHL